MCLASRRIWWRDPRLLIWPPLRSVVRICVKSVHQNGLIMQRLTAELCRSVLTLLFFLFIYLFICLFVCLFCFICLFLFFVEGRWYVLQHIYSYCSLAPFCCRRLCAALSLLPLFLLDTLFNMTSKAWICATTPLLVHFTYHSLSRLFRTKLKKIIRFLQGFYIAVILL